MPYVPPCCPNTACDLHDKPVANFYIKKGYYRQAHRTPPVPRYQCKTCSRYFSTATFKETAGQHRPDFNRTIFELLASGVGNTRIAKLLKCSPRTVDKKIPYLALKAQQAHKTALAAGLLTTTCVLVDELETFVHTKVKPLSIAVAVRFKTGQILGIAVGRMPTKGKLAALGARKYAWTVDERPDKFEQLMQAIAPAIGKAVTFKSDKHPAYGGRIVAVYPRAKLESTVGVKSKRGEPKPYDPLFKINHLFAKMRNDIARLGRKSWHTTKRVDRLDQILWLYLAWNNRYDIKWQNFQAPNSKGETRKSLALDAAGKTSGQLTRTTRTA